VGWVRLGQSVGGLVWLGHTTDLWTTLSDLISMPAGVCRHLVGKTLRNVCHCDALKYALLVAIIWTFS